MNFVLLFTLLQVPYVHGQENYRNTYIITAQMNLQGAHAPQVIAMIAF